MTRYHIVFVDIESIDNNQYVPSLVRRKEVNKRNAHVESGLSYVREIEIHVYGLKQTNVFVLY